MPDIEEKTFKINMKTLGFIITLLTLVAGIGASWAVNNATLNQLQKDFVELKEEYKEYKERTSNSIVNIKLDVASYGQDISTIKDDVKEIKDDIKKILRGS